jgi:hypothetical protein
MTMFNDRRDVTSPEAQASHAKLEADWQKSFKALKKAGLESGADHPIAAAYRSASNAVNHSNRSRDYAIATGQLPTKGSTPTVRAPRRGR